MACKKKSHALLHRYGSWALVAGASEGLGAAFAEALAEQGLNLVLVARRREPLEALAARLEQTWWVTVECIVADLGDADTPDIIMKSTSSMDIGLLVYNAAYAPVGRFAEQTMDQITQAIVVNVRGPLRLVHPMLPRLTARTGTSPENPAVPRRGGVILMSSLSGNQGSPRLAVYSASKAFNSIFAQGLWYELREDGVDITACCAGAIRTPGYLGAAGGNDAAKEAPGTMDADRVAAVALRALGRKPLVVPGFVNKVARFLMTRVLPNKVAVRIMAASTQDLA